MTEERKKDLVNRFFQEEDAMKEKVAQIEYEIREKEREIRLIKEESANFKRFYRKSDGDWLTFKEEFAKALRLTRNESVF